MDGGIISTYYHSNDLNGLANKGNKTKKRLIFGGFKQKSSVKNRLISFGDSYLEEKESIKSPTTRSSLLICI